MVTLLGELPRLPLKEGYRERAGALRATLIAACGKAPLADALIAQCCLDPGLRLVSRDADFGHFVRVAGLQLLP